MWVGGERGLIGWVERGGLRGGEERVACIDRV